MIHQKKAIKGNEITSGGKIIFGTCHEHKIEGKRSIKVNLKISNYFILEMSSFCVRSPVKDEFFSFATRNESGLIENNVATRFLVTWGFYLYKVSAFHRPYIKLSTSPLCILKFNSAFQTQKVYVKSFDKNSKNFR